MRCWHSKSREMLLVLQIMHVLEAMCCRVTHDSRVHLSCSSSMQGFSLGTLGNCYCRLPVISQIGEGGRRGVAAGATPALSVTSCLFFTRTQSFQGFLPQISPTAWPWRILCQWPAWPPVWSRSVSRCAAMSSPTSTRSTAASRTLQR